MRKSSRLILAAAGPGWSMWMPVALWDALTPDERKSRQDAQERLFRYNLPLSVINRVTDDSRHVGGETSADSEAGND